MQGRLTPLQERVLAVLADIQPPWTLTGGAALAGFHLGHRATKDLDLFFLGERTLDLLPRLATDRLLAAGLRVERVQDAASFCRLRASDPTESVLVDLVAEPVPNVHPPIQVALGELRLRVDSPAEILGNKLGALYSRWELRDLVDVHALLAAGGDLDDALHVAAAKDGGFSRADLAWVLQSLDVVRLAEAERYDGAVLEVFRRQLIDRLLR